ncbi:hypothetical protein B0H17DRAFT_1201877 [Mycena rosella]|uniref:Uncharacterized protein n=1 Tax=Mycena rosella TaxID=1033263 RepID=A0AAD7GDV3_MYCRO|nr:hypothetical protein B0H17DRAFT_1201877 [Mycena rosella]
MSEIFMLRTLLSGAIVLFLRSARRQQGLPPGEDMDKEGLISRLAEWAHHYGDIHSLKIGSGTMIVLSSATAGRADDCASFALYSSLRPPANIPGSSALRRVFARFFWAQNSLKYVAAQAGESTVLLHDLIAQPKSLDQPVQVLACGACPPFDLLPVLKYLPAPFEPWHALDRPVELVHTGLHTQMHQTLQRQQAAGDDESTQCFARSWMEIDGVIAGGRLLLADSSKLPYLDTLIK